MAKQNKQKDWVVLKIIGKNSVKAGKELATTVLKNTTRALQTGAKVGSAAVSKNLKKVLSSDPDVITFYHTGKGLYPGKIEELQKATTFRDTQMCIQFYPTSTLEPLTNVEKRLENKIKDRNSFNKSDKRYMEMITYFEDENKNTKTYKK